ncbi:MAG: nucleotidyltransferase domain-containing protein [Leptospiraceae bacterium]|nr:nucleotidyltransferase domain-containing protein [Leptospiraceae bacterium]MCP5493486.1 nucleotidyltransferase domain-containing protein [Leptospiraceae bacterium]
MIELKIDDPAIEEFYKYPEEIINLLKAIVNQKAKVVYIDDLRILEHSEISEVLNEYFKDKPVIKAYLFGSYARKEAKPESDLDILVELDYSTKIGSAFFCMSDELQELFGKKVDLLSSEAMTDVIKETIYKERKVIYERKS